MSAISLSKVQIDEISTLVFEKLKEEYSFIKKPEAGNLDSSKDYKIRILDSIFEFVRIEKQIINFEHLKGRVRTNRMCDARHLCFLIARTYFPQIPLQSIGDYFGNRKHATVLSGIKNISDQIKVDKNKSTEVNNILLKFESSVRVGL